MYLPSLIPNDVRTIWINSANTQTDHRLYARTIDSNNINNNSNIQQQQQQPTVTNRKLDYPPLSFYTPLHPGPINITPLSLHACSVIEGCGGNSKGTTMDQLGLEIGKRLEEMKEINVLGYSYLKPTGIEKTMSRLVEERDRITAGEIGDDYEDDINEEDIAGDESNNIEHSNLMHENIGGAAGGAGHVIDNESEEDNEEIDQEGDDDNIGNMAIEDAYGQNDDEATNNFTHSRFINSTLFERDLDAELSNHDILGSGDYSVVNENNEIESTVNTRMPENDRLENALHSSFHEDDDDGDQRIANGSDERFFMAFEEYQDDHSMIESTVNKLARLGGERSVSIAESAFTRISSGGRRNNNLESANLTTPSSVNSNTVLQSTGDTSFVEDSNESDFEMTIE